MERNLKKNSVARIWLLRQSQKLMRLMLKKNKQLNFLMMKKLKKTVMLLNFYARLLGILGKDKN